MDLHHHLRVVEKLKEVVFKLDLDKILLNLFIRATMSSPCSMSLSQTLPQALPSPECRTEEELKLDRNNNVHDLHLVRVVKEPRHKEVWVGQTKR